MTLSISCQCLPVPLELLRPWEGPQAQQFPCSFIKPGKDSVWFRALRSLPSPLHSHGGHPGAAQTDWGCWDLSLPQTRMEAGKPHLGVVAAG